MRTSLAKLGFKESRSASGISSSDATARQLFSPSYENPCSSSSSSVPSSQCAQALTEPGACGLVAGLGTTDMDVLGGGGDLLVEELETIETIGVLVGVGVANVPLPILFPY